MNTSNLFLSSFLSLCFIFFVESSYSSLNNTIHKCSKEQSRALLLLKQSLPSSNFTFYQCQDWLGFSYYPIMRNWKMSIDCCNWNGVTCDHYTGDVIGVNLACGMLQGTINPNTTLLQLPHLQRLNLAYSDFTGTNFLPQVLGRFASTLTHLNISHCRFTGQIPPEISFLSKLVSLDLSQNDGLYSQPYVLNNLLRNSTYLRELVIADVNMAGWILPTYLNISSPLKTLDLSFTGLQGKLPDNIFCLPYLEKLDLSHNTNISVSSAKVNRSTSNPLKWLDMSNSNLSLGEIPDSIFHLRSLNYLFLISCGLSGSLPESLLNLSHLITLNLSFNMLNGTLPSFLFTLPFLENIQLARNMFSGGLPLELYNHRPLKRLWLIYNQFDGEINAGSSSPSMIQLTNLNSLGLSYNSFKGVVELDALFSSLPNLIYLDLYYSGLSVVTKNATCDSNLDILVLRLTSCKLNVFPACLRTMKNLQQLDLSGNEIRGQIPDWLGEIGRNNLRYLDLSHNSITGLPQFQWDRLGALFLQSNKIEGPFPPSICNMTYLSSLDISNNSFRGVIPQCVEHMTTLTMINLGNNHFHGIIPNMCKDRGGRLEGLLLNGNQLEGDIPTSLSKCSLRVLHLGNNHLNGTFPSWLADLKYLQVLVVKSNNLHGSIDSFSKTEFPFPFLQVLDLSNNQFVGHLPQKYFQNFYNMKDIERKGSTPTYLTLPLLLSYYSITLTVKGHELLFQRILMGYTIIDLSNNKFEGEIPNVVVGSLNSLIVLNLSHNLLDGRIPNDLGNLSMIESLDLSWNKLVGEIPQSLADITTLGVLNLSQNNLMGRIPKGKQFSTFDQSSYWGNPKLCGVPLSQHCEHKSSLPLGQGEEDEDESLFTWKVVMMGYAFGTLLGFLMGYVMLSMGRPKWFNSIANAGWHMVQTMRKIKR